MNTEQSVLDEIDALVDEQLAQEASGYDHNINQPNCRCGVLWHGLPRDGCPGASNEGPIRRYVTGGASITVLADFQQFTDSITAAMERIREAFQGLSESFAQLAVRRWLPGDADREVMRLAIPRPDTTPPMWAQDVTRTRRNRKSSRRVK